jgi:hypothetical protein
MKTTYVLMQMIVAIEHADKAKEDELMDYADDIAAGLRVNESLYGAMGAMGAMRAVSQPASVKFDVQPDSDTHRRDSARKTT